MRANEPSKGGPESLLAHSEYLPPSTALQTAGTAQDDQGAAFARHHGEQSLSEATVSGRRRTIRSSIVPAPHRELESSRRRPRREVSRCIGPIKKFSAPTLLVFQ